jgi:glucose-1-phosphate cytidylyltransferase
MKTVILCGGRGTRLNEMGLAVPKALVPIGDRPLIWHLLKSFSSQGFSDFVFCLGFLGDKISEYVCTRPVSNMSNGGLNVDLDGSICSITLVDTGTDTNTGGRIKAVEASLAGEDTFIVTYGDGLSDVDLNMLREFHQGHGKTATLTAIHPTSNYGILDVDDAGTVRQFCEKPRMKEWVNGGFFVFNKSIFRYIDENSVLEREPLMTLSQQGELMAYRHNGFWKCMDTFKDSVEMNELWKNSAPWKTW